MLSSLHAVLLRFCHSSFSPSLNCTSGQVTFLVFSVLGLGLVLMATDPFKAGHTVLLLRKYGRVLFAGLVYAALSAGLMVKTLVSTDMRLCVKKFRF